MSTPNSSACMARWVTCRPSMKPGISHGGARPRRTPGTTKAVRVGGPKATAAIARRDPLKRVRFVDRLIGRLAELSQLLKRARFAAALRFRQVECICPALLLAEGHDRRHTNQGGDRLRVRLGMQKTQ